MADKKERVNEDAVSAAAERKGGGMKNAPMFTTPCHIRKNTPELRRKLSEVGYRLNNGKWMGRYLVTFRLADTGEWRFVGFPEYDLKNNPDARVSVDCGDNEQLFLALAALRRDTHKNQWHICVQDYLGLPDLNEHKEGEWCMCQVDRAHKYYWRKATKKELIEHFKFK